MLHLKRVSDKITRPQLLEFLFVAESPSSHPIASALVAAVRNEGVACRSHLVVENHTVLEGEGVVVNVDGVKIHVGNKRLFNRLGLLQQLSPEVAREVEDWAVNLGTVGFISVERMGIVGTYCVADAVRPESAEVLEELKKLGIEATMLTGDARKSALVVGNQIGLSPENIRSDLLPSEKLNIVSGMKEESVPGLFFNIWNRSRLVLMCGDGVNDAPALACADVGVAMGAGAALSMETSDVTLMDSHLSKLVYCLKLGRRVKRTILENFIFSFTAKAAVMVLIFMNMSSLWFAIVSDVGAMLIVTMNGMKLLPRKKEKKRMVEDDEMMDDNVDGASCHAKETEHCHSGCCDENMVELNEMDVTMMEDVEGALLKVNEYEHCHTGCCGGKKGD